MHLVHLSTHLVLHVTAAALHAFHMSFLSGSNLVNKRFVRGCKVMPLHGNLLFSSERQSSLNISGHFADLDASFV